VSIGTQPCKHYCQSVMPVSSRATSSSGW